MPIESASISAESASDKIEADSVPPDAWAARAESNAGKSESNATEIESNAGIPRRLCVRQVEGNPSEKAFFAVFRGLKSCFLISFMVHPTNA